jgi:hypothetical protein
LHPPAIPLSTFKRKHRLARGQIFSPWPTIAEATALAAPVFSDGGELAPVARKGLPDATEHKKCGDRQMTSQKFVTS